MPTPLYCVEDDLNISELIAYVLRGHDFEVHSFSEAQSFLEAMKQSRPAVILLDIMLPGMDGMELLRQVRANKDYSDIPVIMLTAKTAEFDVVKGLDEGADDYIKKPFSVVELVSRIRAVMRRYKKEECLEKMVIECGEIHIDKRKRRVQVRGKKVDLTLKEFELLTYLVENVDIVLTREQMMNTVWGFSYEGESRTVDMHVKTLRKKLGKEQSHLCTVRGIGYVWKVKVEE